MSVELKYVTVNSLNPTEIAQWWATALGAKVIFDAGEYVALDTGPVGLGFQKADKAIGNTMHIDLQADDRQAEVERFVSLGATVVAERTVPEANLAWTVMTDPDGNEFCICSPH